MDDQFLKQYRQPPRPEFARQLKDKMEEGSMKMAQPKTWRQNILRWSPALLVAAVVARGAVGSRGYFELDGVPTGRYSLTVILPDAAVQIREVEV